MISKLIIGYFLFHQCHSIIIRHDVNPSRYNGVSSQYPAVFHYPDTVKLGFGCSATLISPVYAVTAAHCFDDIRAPFTATIGGVQHRISTVLVNPCFSFESDGPNVMDLALIKLDTPSSNPPQSMYRFNDEVGKTITLVGWGDLCVAGNHHPSKCRGGNRFRIGKNIINRITENTLQYSLDRPSHGGLDLEAIGWSGDSGGPALIERDGKLYVTGVNSGGDCCSYGSVDEICRLSSKISQDFIQKSIIDNSYDLRDDYACDGEEEGEEEDEEYDDVDDYYENYYTY